MVVVSKTPRSFTIDEDIAEALSDRDDINASGVVNDFLREFVTGGKSTEAALEVRLNQLDEEIADVEQELTRLRRERERVETRLDERRSALAEELDEFEAMIDRGEFDPADIDPSNLAIQKAASRAEVEAHKFAAELEGRL